MGPTHEFKIARANFLIGDAVNKILAGAPMLEELSLWSFNFSEEFYIKSSSLKKVNIGGTSLVMQIFRLR